MGLGRKGCKACRIQACIDAGMKPTDVIIKAEAFEAKKLKNKDECESISSLSVESELSTFSSSTCNPSQTVNDSLEAINAIYTQIMDEARRYETDSQIIQRPGTEHKQ